MKLKLAILPTVLIVFGVILVAAFVIGGIIGVVKTVKIWREKKEKK